MNTTRFTFKKEERLCSKKLIDKVFEGKKVIHLFPFSIYYQSCEQDIPYPAQVLFAVSKKNFKKAVDRNHIKRLCRESYRIYKHNIYDILTKEHKKALLVVVYNNKEQMSFETIQSKMQLAIDKTIQQLIK